MKPKTAFESGNSPPKVSENGAPIQTGRGLQQVLKEITEKFERIRKHSEQGPDRGLAESPQAPVVYDEQHVARFHQRAKRLSLAALESARISTRTRRRDVVCWEISVPNQSFDEIVKEALGE